MALTSCAEDCIYIDSDTMEMYVGINMSSNSSSISIFGNVFWRKIGESISNYNGLVNIRTNDKNVLSTDNNGNIEVGNESNSLSINAKKIYYGLNFNSIIRIDFIYDECSEFHEGYMAVKKNSKWGVINIKDELIVPYQYDYISEFKYGYAIVKNNAIVCDNAQVKGQTCISGKTIISGDTMVDENSEIYNNYIR
jgi:hypothetical protein